MDPISPIVVTPKKDGGIRLCVDMREANQYKRLNCGTNSAAEIFQNVLQQNLSDIRGVKNLVDDIIIHGKTRKSHDEALEKCLKRLAALKLETAGTKPDPERIENMVRVPAPKTAGEVRSFLGIANTCHEYIPDYATITAPLRELTKKNIAFKWENRHQKAFEQLKKKLTSIPVMAYFDTKKRSLVIVDGSPYGISAILAQKEHHSQQLCADEVTYNASAGILLKNTRLVIPTTLQERATKLGHIGHQGIEKTKSLLREKIWYPNMDKQVKEMVDKCIPCQAVGHGDNPGPMKIRPTEDKPWTSVAIDFYGPVHRTGQYLLVVIDTYSKFPEVEIVNATEAKTFIPKLDTIFARYGIP
ncbi:Transposon Ty3-I Gag-Pol poly [Paramuricea clavata]|uniref:Transposon Ty3-I Gag-Pol poly n=1 Tax=Paramuricea clavata TaxID=317549 RepID=A0A7D9DIC1_PARCT|nr:Transposon Ty3-I Gag-Pol poly [Paramuricea clavata]